MKILFVCRGNVGRSQKAEEMFKLLTSGHEVISAGTRVLSKDGVSKHGQLLKDLDAADNVIIPLQELNIDVRNNPRTQLDESLVDWADKIINMSEPETMPEYLSNSPKMIHWEVRDPKGLSVDESRIILNQIKDLVQDFIKQNSL
jgi:protein-tyrosine-phosphatase